MDDLQNSEEIAFVVEDVNNIIKESIEATLQNAVYQRHNKVKQWTSSVTEQVLKRLTALNKPFKYIGAGLHVANSCHWDNASDASRIFILGKTCTVRNPVLFSPAFPGVVSLSQ